MFNPSPDETQFLQYVGQRIRTYRELRSFDLNDLAARVALGDDELREIESGHRSLYLSELLAIARTLEVSPADLVRVQDSAC